MNSVHLLTRISIITFQSEKERDLLQLEKQVGDDKAVQNKIEEISRELEDKCKSLETLESFKEGQSDDEVVIKLRRAKCLPLRVSFD